MKDTAVSLHQMVRRNDKDGVRDLLERHGLPSARRESPTLKSKTAKRSSAVPPALRQRRNSIELKNILLEEKNTGKCVSCHQPVPSNSDKSTTTTTMGNDVTEPAFSLNRRGSLGRTPLLLAACFQRVDIAQMLVDAGCDVTAVDSQGRQAVHEAVTKACPDLVNVLLDSGRCDVDAKTPQGTTPLMLAATYDYAEIARLLVKEGANLESRDAEGRSCLHIALEEGSEACAIYLMQAGCDVNALDKNGRSCLHLATHSSHLFSTKVIEALLTSRYDCQKDVCWLRAERQPSVFYNAKSLYHEVLRSAGITPTTTSVCDDPYVTPVAVRTRHHVT